MVCAPHNFMLSLLQKTTLALPLMKSVRPCENLIYHMSASFQEIKWELHIALKTIRTLILSQVSKVRVSKSFFFAGRRNFSLPWSLLLLPLLLLWRKFGLIYQLLRRKGLLFVAGHGCGFHSPINEKVGRRRRLFDHIKIRRRTCETNVVFATSTTAKYVTDIPFSPFLEVNSPDGKRQELSTF